MVRKDNNISFFDGGVAKVSDEYIIQFLEIYSKYCLSHATYLIEKPSKGIATINGVGFRYVMDIDFKLPLHEELPSRQYLVFEVVPLIQSCIKDIFDMDTLTLFICTCDNKIGAQYHKTGLHLVWKDIYVCDPIALACRLHISKTLDKMHKPIGHKSWGDIIDEKIYDGSGMRALYAHKANVSKECKQLKSFHRCEKCDGYGHVPEGRPYTIFHTMDGITPDTTLDTILATTILLPQVHSRYKCTILEPELQNKKINTKRMKYKTVTRLKSNGNENMTEAMIRAFLLHSTSQPDISQIKIISPGTYFVYTHTKNCCIAKREHTSNHIYFIINPCGCYQRCFSNGCKDKEVKTILSPELKCALESMSVEIIKIPGT